MSEPNTNKGRLWFTRRRGEVRGPFPGAQITRYILLGRLRPDDELSLDRSDWQRLGGVVEVQPTGLETPQDQVLALRQADERLAEDRRDNQSAAVTARFHNRRQGDRRCGEPEQVVQHRALKTRLVKDDASPRETVMRQALFAVALLALIFIAMIVYTPESVENKLDCAAPAGPHVNWNNCHKAGIRLEGVELSAAHIKNADLSGAHLRGAKLAGSDLSYTSLNIADLSYSDLHNASLVGAGLRGADLSYANLRDANLSYATLSDANLGAADLSGAKLDHALWTDGRSCAPGSIGQCIKQ